MHISNVISIGIVLLEHTGESIHHVCPGDSVTLYNICIYVIVRLLLSNFLVLPYVFCRLTNPAYFHRFQQFWSQSVQLVQEMAAMTFGISDFYTFENI